MVSKKHVIINGAGIAGLSAALAFTKAGWYVEIFEQAAALEPIGAGIQLTPNMFRALAEIDETLIKQIRNVSTHPEEISIYKAGKHFPLTGIPLGRQTEIDYGYPYTVIHRADLHNLLLAKCNSDPDIEITFASSVIDFAPHKNGNTVLVKHKTGHQEITCSLLVVADGIGSQLRTKKLNLTKPLDSGKFAWRCIIPEHLIEDKNQLRRISLRLAKNRHVVSYPVRSGEYLNMVVIMDKALTEDATSLSGEEMSVHFKKWSQEFKDQLKITSNWTGWPLLEMASFDKPKQKSVVIIGDAAHAMLPYAAQGAGMAIEDAVTLAKLVTQADDLEEALNKFYKTRQKRVNKAAKLARTNGKYYHDSGHMAFMRNMALRLIPGRFLLARQKWIYNWKP